MTAKEQKIKEAWIKAVGEEQYDAISRSITKNGSINAWIFSPGMIGYEITQKGQKHYMWRPKALKGIETNHGWTRCDESMPDTDGDGNYLIIFLSKYGDESTFYLDDVNNNSVWYKQHYTHWRPKTEYPLPIY